MIYFCQIVFIVDIQMGVCFILEIDTAVPVSNFLPDLICSLQHDAVSIKNRLNVYSQRELLLKHAAVLLMES